MVEVGALEIAGSLDISNITRGQRAISRGFENVKQKTQSSFSSMELLAGSAKSLGSALTTVATTAVGGLTLLAGLTPTLAPEFAKIKVETFKLAQIFGKEMKPALESVTSAYSGFVNFLSQDTGLGNFAKDTILLAGAGGALSMLGSKLLGIKGLGKIVIPIAIPYEIIKNQENIADYGKSKGESFARALGAPEGGFTEGALGKSGSLLSSSLAAGLGGAGLGFMFGGVGAIPGFIAGATAGFGYELYDIIRDDFFNDVDSSGR
jgi:hypothetical protein